MANKSVFATIAGKLLPRAAAQNHEGAKAYALGPETALAQLAATGTFNATFYAEPKAQVDEILKLAFEVEPEYLARTAIYAYEQGYMKDMPALLLAILSMMQNDAFTRAFPRIVKNGKMLRNFVQIMRSGVTGRKSLGTRPKRMIEAWLQTASDRMIMQAAVGNDPSLADVIRMVHPKPATASRAALYAYLIGRPHDPSALPQLVKDFEAFKADPDRPVPDVPFQMLTSTSLSKEHWATIADQSSWQMLRQNLNTFARHGVFELWGFTKKLAERLADPDEIRKARVFPYQLMVAYANTDAGVPDRIKVALQEAMEIALDNVPKINGQVVICPDVSGSMASPVTGVRQGATSKIRCIDVAGLVAAAFLRQNRTARVLPFEVDVVDIRLDPYDSVMTNATKLASIGGGGTNCSAPLLKLVEEKAAVDLVVFVSDNQSWADSSVGEGAGTAMMAAWRQLKRLNPAARLVCIDIQPYTTSQAAKEVDVLNIGGFSDRVFEVIGSMMASGSDADHWVKTIEKIDL